MSDSGKTPMDKEAAARIQHSEAIKGSGKTKKDSFPARAQAAADKNVNEELVPPPILLMSW